MIQQEKRLSMPSRRPPGDADPADAPCFGIGDQALSRQHDHGCSQERTYPHRHTEACAVLRLNR